MNNRAIAVGLPSMKTVAGSKLKVTPVVWVDDQLGEVGIALIDESGDEVLSETQQPMSPTNLVLKRMWLAIKIMEYLNGVDQDLMEVCVEAVKWSRPVELTYESALLSKQFGDMETLQSVLTEVQAMAPPRSTMATMRRRLRHLKVKGRTQ